MTIESTVLTGQKGQFSLPEGIHYLNCATRSPFSRAVEKAGHDALTRHANPFSLHPDDFFSGAVHVRSLFAELINTPDRDRIAVIPSVSYGMGVVARNLPRKPGIGPGQRIVLVDGEFPSDVYAWERVCAELNLTITVVTKIGRAHV